MFNPKTSQESTTVSTTNNGLLLDWSIDPTPFLSSNHQQNDPNQFSTINQVPIILQYSLHSLATLKPPRLIDLIHEAAIEFQLDPKSIHLAILINQAHVKISQSLYERIAPLSTIHVQHHHHHQTHQHSSTEYRSGPTHRQVDLPSADHHSLSQTQTHQIHAGSGSPSSSAFDPSSVSSIANVLSNLTPTSTQSPATATTLTSSNPIVGACPIHQDLTPTLSSSGSPAAAAPPTTNLLPASPAPASGLPSSQAQEKLTSDPLAASPSNNKNHCHHQSSKKNTTTTTATTTHALVIRNSQQKKKFLINSLAQNQLDQDPQNSTKGPRARLRFPFLSHRAASLHSSSTPSSSSPTGPTTTSHTSSSNPSTQTSTTTIDAHHHLLSLDSSPAHQNDLLDLSFLNELENASKITPISP